jgi:hypothetical protein
VGRGLPIGTRLRSVRMARPAAFTWVSSPLRSLTASPFSQCHAVNVFFWLLVFLQKIPFDYFVIHKPVVKPIRLLLSRNWLGCKTAWYDLPGGVKVRMLWVGPSDRESATSGRERKMPLHLPAPLTQPDASQARRQRGVVRQRQRQRELQQERWRAREGPSSWSAPPCAPQLPCIGGDWLLVAARMFPFLIVALFDTALFYQVKRMQRSGNCASEGLRSPSLQPCTRPAHDASCCAFSPAVYGHGLRLVRRHLQVRPGHRVQLVRLRGGTRGLIREGGHLRPDQTARQRVLLHSHKSMHTAPNPSCLLARSLFTSLP